MPDEPFMLVSLEEAKAKKLAQVLSNETCTKLLNYLSTHKEATESELAKKLKLPLSTVHYNLKQLVEAKLVLADEYHYSAKGREVNHYKLANKYIIIAPHEDKGGFMDKLKTFLPVTLITVATAAVLKVLSVINGVGFRTMGASEAFSSDTGAFAAKATPVVAPMADMAEEAPMAARAYGEAEAGAPVLEAVVDESVNMAVNETVRAPPNPVFLQDQAIMPGGCVVEPTPFFSNPLILAFLVGGLFAIGVLILIAYIRHKKKKK